MSPSESVQPSDTTTHHLLAANINLCLEYNFVTSVTSLIMVLSKKASEEATRQPCTAAVPGAVTPSSSGGPGLRAGTAQPASMPRFSPESKPMKAASTMSVSATNVPSSEELEPPSQSSSCIPSSLSLKHKTAAQRDSGI